MTGTVALVAALLAFVTPAHAATDFTKYLTGDTVSPTGTTINLFDYWVANSDNDGSQNINQSGANDSTGINAGHSLKFNGGGGTGINKWTGSSRPNNFVTNTLVNGYPQISSGSESLAYLFDTSAQAGKTAYHNVRGLLRSQGGYFTYDSTQNFAAYNKDTNAFDVYNTWGIKSGGAGGDQNGQFFPFNSASDVFSATPSGSLTQQNINCSNNSTLNHHFGLTMETRFSQPTDGRVIYNGQPQDMTYEFSGDDDVWVYIDGVLVGDLGGIHDAASLKINFNTGDVQVNGSSNGSLKSLYQKAGKADSTTWDGNTFKSGTQHTLKFFYLERGAWASNMKLKFNLSEQPVSEIKKADQNGNPVAGATFKLYSADENYSYTENELLASGTTDDAGSLQLMEADGSPISFDYEYLTNHREHYVLKEVAPPTGYHTSLTAGDKELHLDYARTKDTDSSVSGGALVSSSQSTDYEGCPIKDAGGNGITVSRQWITGGYVTASETITAKYDLSNITDHNGNSLSSGLTFAVVLRNANVGSAEDYKKDSNWLAVKGNDLYGYTVSGEHAVAGAVDAAHDAEKNGYSTVFTPSATGFYGTTLSHLPGDISTYAFMMTQKDAAAGKAQYVVAIYHTTASSLGEATVDNTARVESSNFERKFSSRLDLTNVQNRLWVQKVDETGTPVIGAKFELYQAKDVTVGQDGSYTINEGAQPYDTATTKAETVYYGLEGAVSFPWGSDQRKPLVKGVYYLRESEAPDGYTRNETITRVYVDDSGVYVDAGKTGDGVRSMSGPGSLLSLLSQFGRTTGLDDTLAYIKGTLQSATVGGDGDLVWSRDASTSEGIASNSQLVNGWLNMKYNGSLVEGKPVLKYATDDDAAVLPIIYADTGINRMRLLQNTQKMTSGEDLGDLQINQLFTQAAGVEYTDARVASLEVTKRVTADDGLTAPDASFSFRFELPKSNEGFDACVLNADGTAAGTAFKLKSGDVHAITAGQTIRVYGLSARDLYKVEEITTKAQASEGDLLATLGTFLTQSGEKSSLPDGFSLVLRLRGGEKLEGEGNSIEGRLEASSGDQTPDANKLVFVNNYSVASTTLPASEGFWAKKVLSGRDWRDDDSFTLRLQAQDGIPMPKGAQVGDSGPYVDVKVTSKDKDANVSFGDITFNVPGTYAYSIFELSDQQDGMSFSAASYEVRVTVEDQHDGTLKVADVSVTKKTDDAGASVPASAASVADKVAAFTNTYNDCTSSVSLVANKAYTDNSGSNPLTGGMFAFSLEAIGGYDSDTAAFDLDTVDTSIKGPMPAGASDGVITTANDVSGNVKFPSIGFTALADAGKTYVYRLAEVSAGKPGYTYDGSEYYVVVRGHRNGAGIDTEYLYNKIVDGKPQALAKGVVPSFSNSYDVEAVTAAPIAGIKTLTGRSWRSGNGDTFSFAYSVADPATTEAVKSGSVVLPASTEGQAKGTSGDAVTKDIDFGQTGITFKRPGTYTFAVSEKYTSSEEAGLSYDQHVSKVTYVVSDLDAEGNRTGKLAVSVSYDNSAALTATDRAYTDGVAFTNAYHAQTKFAGVDLTKTMRGRDLGEGDYTFNVKGLTYNGHETTVDQAESLVATPAAGEGQAAHVTVNGGKILSRILTERDLGRVYSYRISEVHGADADGYKYDTLNSGDAIVLLEAYLDDSADSNLSKLNYLVTVLKGQKVVDMLKDAGGDADVFTGEKIDELIEASKSDPGLYAVQYDSAKAPDAAANPMVAFVNEYAASLDYKAEGGLTLVKKLEVPEGGTPGSPNQDFWFELVPQATEGGTTAQEAADKLGIELDGEFFFTGKMGYGTKNVDLLPNGLTFTQADAGKTFTYTVKETAGADAGYTYDDATYTVVISVADNRNGTMTAITTVSKTGANGGATDVLDTYSYTTGQGGEKKAQVPITNTYGISQPVTVSTDALFDKRLVGRDWSADDAFTFEISADQASAAGTPLPASTTVSVASPGAKDSNNVRFGFGSIEFDAPGTYIYDVRETGEDAHGIALDRHVAKLTVYVTDNGYGTLFISKSAVVGESVFTNTYNSKLDYRAAGGLWLAKTLNGRAMKDGQFNFMLVAEDKASADRLGIDLNQGLELSAPASSAGVASSEVDVLGGHSLVFTQADAGKTYRYRLTEVVPETAAPGYTYDADSRSITITVTDNGKGTLAAKTTVTGGGQDQSAEYATGQQSASRLVIPFVNSYKATGELGGDGNVKIDATKELTGRELKDGEFSFQVVEAGDVEKVVSQGTNDADGKITFSPIEYDQDEVGTHQYVVREVTDKLPVGVKGDDAEFAITVTVTDNGDGTLSTSVAYPNDADSLTFKNKYGSSSMVEVPMKGTKTYEVPQGEGYNAPSIEGKFEFTLTGKDGAPMPEDSSDDTKVVTNKAGTVDFGSITYEMSDVDGAPGRSKTFTYTVAETGGEVAGVTRDSSVKTIKVTVTDKGDGTLDVEVANATDGQSTPLDRGALKFGFTNVYSVAPVESSVTDKGGISITKKLSGRELREGEFTFRLVDQKTGEDVVSPATNDAQGNVRFGAITYTQPGSYSYKVAEEQGGAGGITFDRTEHVVRVTVTDNGGGALEAQTELLDATGKVTDKAGVTFENSYTPADGSVRIVASKTLEGASLADGQFVFELTDDAGNVLQTVRNAVDGSVTFDALTYGAADAGKTYVYHVREVNDGQANVTYDTDVRNFTVSVADDGEGQIVASVSGADSLAFTNVYHEPETPDAPEQNPSGPADGPDSGQEVPDLPDTGDHSVTLPLLGGLAGAGAAALLAAFVVRRRRG